MNECCHVYLPNFMIGFKPTNKNLAPLLQSNFHLMYRITGERKRITPF